MQKLKKKEKKKTNLS